MSFRLTKLAMNADFKDDPVAKNVMIALCWSFFDGAKHATLNEERICRRTAYKKRTVQEALVRLKAELPAAPAKGAAAASFPAAKKSRSKTCAWGLIQIDYFGVGAGTSPKYTINEARLETMQFPEQLTLKLTSLRAVEPIQKGAAAASLMGQKSAAASEKGAAAAPYTWNNHSSYNPSLLPEPTGVEGGEGKQTVPLKSRYTAKQWHAYAKSQPDIRNVFSYVNSRINTTIYDDVLELWLEQQMAKARPALNPDCPVCRGTGWEHVPGKGVRPCGCRAQAKSYGQ